MKPILIDITQEFINRSTPGIGSISYENGLDIKSHINEIKTARWLLDTFGGHITVLKEKNLYKIKTPDYEWNGKLWELKSPSSTIAIQEAIRKAYKQIINSPGGIIIDVSQIKGYKNKIITIVNDRLIKTNLSINYLILKNNDSLIAVLTNKKRS